MRKMRFGEAIDDALGQAMGDDARIIVLGEDVQISRMPLYARFGPQRIRNTPISESAFLGASVSAAMAGLRPVTEMLLVDFLAVAMDSLVNHAAKIEFFSGGEWQVPLVIRASCGGGYGDAGQHEQSWWGWLAHIPGISVVVPATPADAGGLLLAALEQDGPVVYLEHKLLSENWLEAMGSGGRDTVQFDVPAEGAEGPVPNRWAALPLGKAVHYRDGGDLTIVSVGVGVHRALSAAQQLAESGIEAQVIDLRSVAPLDKEAVRRAVAHTGRLLVVDEDYEAFGLSGELAAVVLEAGIPFRYGRVCTKTTIPYARHLEDQTLPNVEKIVAAARQLMS